MITKYDFLKEYLKSKENIALQDAKDIVKTLIFEREKDTELFESLLESLLNFINEAMENQLEEIAKCPFIKIEISEQAQQQEERCNIDCIVKALYLMEGYLSSLALETKENLQDIKQILLK